MRYDPSRSVVAEEWPQLDEGEQIELEAEHHRRVRTRPPNMRLHVTMENQILLGDKSPTAATLRRLVGEGRGHHDAIHAIASVPLGVMYDAVTRKESGSLKAA